MELIYENESIRFTLKSGTITSILISDEKVIKDIILLRNKTKLIKDKEKIIGKKAYEYFNKMEYIEKEVYIDRKFKTIREYLLDKIREDNIESKNTLKKMISSLKLVGLQKEIDDEIGILSTGEMKLLNIARSLLSNPEIIVFEEMTHNLSFDMERGLYLLINRLKEELAKIIVIITKDSNIAYTKSDYAYVIAKKRILEGKSKELFENVKELNKNNIKLPKAVELANKIIDRKINITYHRDTRDMLKDIYKHI